MEGLPTATQCRKCQRRTKIGITYTGFFAAILDRRSAQTAGEMGLKKACGPGVLSIESAKILASYNMDYLTETINVPIYIGYI